MMNICIKILYPGGELLLEFHCTRSTSGFGYSAILHQTLVKRLNRLLSGFEKTGCFLKCGDKKFIPHISLEPHVISVSKDSCTYYLSQYGNIKIDELGIFSNETTLELYMIAAGIFFIFESSLLEFLGNERNQLESLMIPVSSLSEDSIIDFSLDVVFDVIDEQGKVGSKYYQLKYDHWKRIFSQLTANYKVISYVNIKVSQDIPWPKLELISMLDNEEIGPECFNVQGVSRKLYQTNI